MGLVANIIKGVTESVTDNINKSLDRKFAKSEAERTREFTRELLELELYKNGFGKEIKEVFDYWTDSMRVAQIKDNKNLSEQQKNKYEKEFDKLSALTTISDINTKTLKYGGEKTVNAVVANSHISFNKNDYHKNLPLYSYASIFSSLKKDILNIDLYPEDVLLVYTNDIMTEENMKMLQELKKEYCAVVEKIDKIRTFSIEK